jgi:hypothetical protein
VVDWVYEQGMTIRGLLHEEQLAALKRVFSGEAPWSFELYEPLRALSHALPRLQLADLPSQVRFGDVLSAVDEVVLRDAERGWGEGAYGAGLARHAWRKTPDVSQQCFAALGYAETSTRPTRLREADTATWREHAVSNKELLLEAPATSDAVVIGAGKLYDVPLRELAERHARVTLLDIDGASLVASVEQAGLSPELRQRVELVRADVTQINDAFSRGLHDCFEHDSEAAVHGALLALLYSYRLATPPVSRRAGAALSSMVLSQLATPLTVSLQARFRERFPSSARLEAHATRVALAQFTHRVQHSHLQGLLSSADSIAVTSAISEQLMRVEGESVVAASPSLPLIGAPHLTELFPAQTSHILERTEWPWTRLAVSATQPKGCRRQVVGCLVTSYRNR